MAERRIITLYTDASVDPQTHAAAWACWMKFPNRNTISYSGPFDHEIENVAEAEMKAICNGIYMVCNSITICGDEHIAVVTDCQIALNILTGKWERTKKVVKKQPGLWRAVDEVRAFMYEQGITASYKKVKAHAFDDGARSYVNDLVDKLAKQQMYLVRATLREKRNALPSVPAVRRKS